MLEAYLNCLVYINDELNNLDEEDCCFFNKVEMLERIVGAIKLDITNYALDGAKPCEQI
jgi:hypothetical protein